MCKVVHWYPENADAFVQSLRGSFAATVKNMAPTPPKPDHDHDNYEERGEYIESLRKRGLTTAQIATRIGVSAVTVRKWEDRAARIRRYHLHDINKRVKNPNVFAMYVQSIAE